MAHWQIEFSYYPESSVAVRIRRNSRGPWSDDCGYWPETIVDAASLYSDDMGEAKTYMTWKATLAWLALMHKRGLLLKRQGLPTRAIIYDDALSALFSHITMEELDEYVALIPPDYHIFATEMVRRVKLTLEDQARQIEQLEEEIDSINESWAQAEAGESW